MASRSRVAPSGARDSATGDPIVYRGVFGEIAGEHAQVASLVDQVAGTIEVRVRQDLFPQIRNGLLTHARAEEETFYPVLREIPELERLVTQCLEDHAEVARYLDRLDVKDKSTKLWGDLFDEMKRVVDRHVSREENELFPRAQERIEAAASEAMRDRYKRAAEPPDPLRPL